MARYQAMGTDLRWLLWRSDARHTAAGRSSPLASALQSSGGFSCCVRKFFDR